MEKYFTFVDCRTHSCEDVLTSRFIYRLNEILLIILAVSFFFGRSWQGDSKIYMEVQISKGFQNLYGITINFIIGWNWRTYYKTACFQGLL